MRRLAGTNLLFRKLIVKPIAKNQGVGANPTRIRIRWSVEA